MTTCTSEGTCDAPHYLKNSGAEGHGFGMQLKSKYIQWVQYAESDDLYVMVREHIMKNLGGVLSDMVREISKEVGSCLHEMNIRTTQPRPHKRQRNAGIPMNSNEPKRNKESRASGKRTECASHASVFCDRKDCICEYANLLQTELDDTISTFFETTLPDSIGAYTNENVPKPDTQTKTKTAPLHTAQPRAVDPASHPYSNRHSEQRKRYAPKRVHHEAGRDEDTDNRLHFQRRQSRNLENEKCLEEENGVLKHDMSTYLYQSMQHADYTQLAQHIRTLEKLHSVSPVSGRHPSPRIDSDDDSNHLCLSVLSRSGDPVSRLPVDAWAVILPHLTITEIFQSTCLVSRAWMYMVCKPEAWVLYERLTNETLPLKSLPPCPYNRNLLFRYLSNVKELSIAGRQDVASYLSLVHTHLSQVTSIDASCSGITSLQLVSLSSCSHLKELNLEYCQVDDEAVEAVLTGCPLLSKLILSRCTLSPYVLLRCQRFLCNVTSLQLEELPTTDEILTQLGSQCESLTDISVYAADAVSDIGAMALADGARALQRLDLGHTDITGTAVEWVSNKCPDLRSIRLSHCQGVHDACMLSLADNCPLLHTLVISATSITDAALYHISHMSRLRTLDIRWCTAVTDQGIKQVATYCTQLRQVFLLGTAVTVSCLETFAQHCPFIYIMDCRYCRLLPPAYPIASLFPNIRSPNSS